MSKSNGTVVAAAEKTIADVRPDSPLLAYPAPPAGAVVPDAAAVAAAEIAALRVSMLAELEALKAENAKLKAKANALTFGGLSFRVSEKGAISVYGMGRFPVTLYAEQWAKVLAPEFGAQLKKFIADNVATLKTKGDKANNTVE